MLSTLKFDNEPVRMSRRKPIAALSLLDVRARTRRSVVQMRQRAV